MALERSLLERIDHYEEESLRELTIDKEKLLESVLKHMQNMFNTRQGSAVTLPNYGIPDFNDLVSRFPDAITEIKKAIRDSIKNYEPRLRNIRVKHIPDEENPLNLQFEIAGQLVAGRGRGGSVSFTTIMGESGRIRVWG
ncbi:MAG: type VI secretion system baseplate subunit TssE [Gammaproteobacteria bacterium]|nr:type VI secretion system baseplate subunit TssE [Gammaproteobacteria bacterium]